MEIQTQETHILFYSRLWSTSMYD